jgi:hypothetical protein
VWIKNLTDEEFVDFFLQPGFRCWRSYFATSGASPSVPLLAVFLSTVQSAGATVLPTLAEDFNLSDVPLPRSPRGGNEEKELFARINQMRPDLQKKILQALTATVPVGMYQLNSLHLGGHLDIWMLLGGGIRHYGGTNYGYQLEVSEVHPASITPYAWEQLQPLLAKNNLLTTANGALHLMSKKALTQCVLIDMSYHPVSALDANSFLSFFEEKRIFLGYRPGQQGGELPLTVET